MCLAIKGPDYSLWRTLLQQMNVSVCMKTSAKTSFFHCRLISNWCQFQQVITIYQSLFHMMSSLCLYHELFHHLIHTYLARHYSITLFHWIRKVTPLFHGMKLFSSIMLISGNIQQLLLTINQRYLVEFG